MTAAVSPDLGPSEAMENAMDNGSGDPYPYHRLAGRHIFELNATLADAVLPRSAALRLSQRHGL